MRHYSPYEIIKGNPAQGLVLLADHAMNRLPPEYDRLGLPESAFARHIAYDIGIESLTRQLSAALDSPAVLGCFSRLLIDPNRGEDDPTLIMRISDGAIVPGNHPISTDEWQRRLDRFHRPYHQAVSQTIAEVAAAGARAPLVISLHSFTPAWKGVARPWHAAVLWDNDPRAVFPLIERLEAAGDILVGNNEPYDGALRGDTMYRHCMAAGIPHALIEIRQDLIADDTGVAAWAERLAPILAALNAMPALHAYQRHPSRTGTYRDGDEEEKLL
ncbi:N-formylglutamate amidohydrolase [Sinorhizobium alkalisoli]|uniref:N-formylglutamate amidohydrolase n=1 Tax=Sinorhizobium alkalisoli TaxID=1752398 RepID=A0A1E3VAX6_9HYPH|nr:N-formylglutamate amidohydrolase [Sinorhizobium alkalisoli]ODR90567.1 N-formylglutamate amidohydrolase [Sinorhizobium alkalisoli]